MTSQTQRLTMIATLSSALNSRRPLPHGYSARPMSERDSSALAELYFEAYPRDVVADRVAAADEIERSFLGEYGVIDLALSPVIECQGGLVASVMTVLEAPWDDVPRDPFIIEVMVHPGHRRRGLAEYAIQLVASDMPTSSVPTLALRVMSDNDAARRLYAKLGFKERRTP